MTPKKYAFIFGAFVVVLLIIPSTINCNAEQMNPKDEKQPTDPQLLTENHKHFPCCFIIARFLNVNFEEQVKGNTHWDGTLLSLLRVRDITISDVTLKYDGIFFPGLPLYNDDHILELHIGFMKRNYGHGGYSEEVRSVDPYVADVYLGGIAYDVDVTYES